MRNLRFGPVERPFLSAFLIVLILTAFESAFFVPYFLTNDDIDGLMITKGVGYALHPDDHLFFTNAFLGIILKNLNFLIPIPNWYGYAQVLTQFLAFWVFLSAVFLRSRHLISGILFLIGFLFIDLYYFLQINYTVLSILTCQSGLFLLSNLWEKNGKAFQREILVMGGFCLLLSSLIRLEAFLFAGLTALPFIIGTLRGQKENWRKSIKLFPVILLIAASVFFDRFYYQKDLKWDEFHQAFQSVANHFVYGHFEYNAGTKKYFDAAGWTLNDFHLFESFYFLDKDKFSPEKLKFLGNYFPDFPPRRWAEALPSFMEHFRLTDPITRRNYLIYFTSQNILLCSIFFLFFSPARKVRWILINSLWIIAVVFLLVCVGRAPERLFLPAFGFPVLMAIYYAVPPTFGRSMDRGFLDRYAPQWGKIILGLLLALSIPTAYRFFNINLQYRQREDLFKSTLRSLQPRPEQLYVTWAGHFPYETLNALDSYEFFRDFHLFNLGCFQQSPLSGETLDHFGIRDLFKDLVDRPGRFLICRPDQLVYYEQYLLERERRRVREEEVFPNEFFHVYRIHSIQKEPGPQVYSHRSNGTSKARAAALSNRSLGRKPRWGGPGMAVLLVDGAFVPRV